MDSNKLVNLVISKKQQIMFKKLSSSMPDVILNDRQICDFELLTTGVFSPLNGFMKKIPAKVVLMIVHGLTILIFRYR